MTWQRDQFSHVGVLQSRQNPSQCVHMRDYKVWVSRCPGVDSSLNAPFVAGFTRNGAVRAAAAETQCWDSWSREEGTGVALFTCHAPGPVDGAHARSQQWVLHEARGWVEHRPSRRCLTLMDTGPPLLYKCSPARGTRSGDCGKVLGFELLTCGTVTHFELLFYLKRGPQRILIAVTRNYHM